MRRGMHSTGAGQASHKPGVAIKPCACLNIFRKDAAEAFPLDPEELGQLVWKMPAGRIAAAYGIPEKAIEKHCQALGIKLPPRDYWRNLERISQQEEEE